MIDREALPRTAFRASEASAPDQILAALPSRVALAEAVMAEALSEPGVVAMEGGRGVGKTALVQFVAARMRGRGRLVVSLANPSSQASPGPLTPARITDALLLASGASIGSEGAPPDRLLRSLLTQPGLRDLVLLVDDADALPPDTWRFLDLLLGLAEFGKARLRLVLSGAPGGWPDTARLPRLRKGLRSALVIEPLNRAEAARYVTVAAERAGRTLGRARLERILDRADGSLARLDQAVQNTSSALSRTKALLPQRGLWPALLFGGPVLAGALIAGLVADRPHHAPPDDSRALASAEVVAPTRPDPALPRETGPAAPPPVVKLADSGAGGKAIAGASAFGVVLAHLDVAAAGLAPNTPVPGNAQQPDLSTREAASPETAMPVQPSGAQPFSAHSFGALSPGPVVSRVSPLSGPLHSSPDVSTPVHGLLLVARPGDTLATLYSEVYRGRPAPPFADVSAVNPAPVRPGSLVVFPAPPGGWTRP